MGERTRYVTCNRQRVAHEVNPELDDWSWRCPVCESPVLHRRQPGRRRVYCTNACRQKAYRWRRARREQLDITPPAERAHNRWMTHALRSDHDLVSHRRNRFGYSVTACGTFARAPRDLPRVGRHTKFNATDDKCASCRRVLGLPRRGARNLSEREAPFSLDATSPGFRGRARSPWGQ